MPPPKQGFHDSESVLNTGNLELDAPSEAPVAPWWVSDDHLNTRGLDSPSHVQRLVPKCHAERAHPRAYHPRQHFESVALTGMDLQGVHIPGCTLHGANLMRAALNGANLQGADLRVCLGAMIRGGDTLIALGVCPTEALQWGLGRAAQPPRFV